MEDSSCWNNSQINKPAITTILFSNEQVACFSSSAGHNVAEEWVEDLRQTLVQLARELNQPDVTRLMTLETAFLHQIVQQKLDMRSEKFYPKMRQVSAGTRRWMQYGTPKLMDDVSLLMKVLKKGQGNKMIEYRLVSPAVLRYVLCHLARGHGTLSQTVVYCEQAAVWMQCKMSTSQRCGLVLALYSVVARIRALSLYLMQAMSSGFNKLSVLVFGVPLSGGRGEAQERMVLDGLPKHIRQEGDEQRAIGKDKQKHGLKSMLGDLFNEKTSAIHTSQTTQSVCGDHGSNGFTESDDRGSMAVDDLDLGEVIKRSPSKNSKKRKREASTDKVTTKKIKKGKVLKKKKVEKLDASTTDTTIALMTPNKKKLAAAGANSSITLESNNNNDEIKKKTKKKRISDTASCPKNSLETESTNISPKKHSKSETVSEPLSQKLGQLYKKFNSKSSLHSHVEMDLDGGANSAGERIRKAVVLKKSNSFLSSCSSLLHLPQAMSRKALSTGNLKTGKNKPKKIKKAHVVKET